MKKRRQSYLDVDWVGLGMRGWDIDMSGAELVRDDYNVCHLDRTTLHVALWGTAQFCQFALSDLRLAGVPGLPPLFTVGTTSATAGSGVWNNDWVTYAARFP